MQTKDTPILFFAAFREALGTSSIRLQLHAPCTMAHLLQQLCQEHPKVNAELADREILFAVNQQLATVDTLVHPGDEVALFPFVTGG